MLPQKRRVTTALFPKAVKRGKQLSSGHFSFKYSRDSNIKESKFSFVVSGSVLKKATDRNLIKRRGYSIIRKNNKTIKKLPLVGIFFVKKGVGDISYTQMENEIIFLLKQAGIL